MTKPARKPETMIMETIYRFHPMFAAEQFPICGGHCMTCPIERDPAF